MSRLGCGILVMVASATPACGSTTVSPTFGCGSVEYECGPGMETYVGDAKTGSNERCAGEDAVDPVSGEVVGGCVTEGSCHVACVYPQKCKCGVTKVTEGGYECATCACNDGERRCGSIASTVDICSRGAWKADTPCPVTTPTCATSGGNVTCIPACKSNEVFCKQLCIATLEDPTACGPDCAHAVVCTSEDPNKPVQCVQGECKTGSCTGGTTECNKLCVDLQTSTSNCGQCGNTCPSVNGSPKCEGGACQPLTCYDGYIHCTVSATDGCETSIPNTKDYCIIQDASTGKLKCYLPGAQPPGDNKHQCDPAKNNAGWSDRPEWVCEVTPAPCSGHGTCVPAGGVATCACEVGYVPMGAECLDERWGTGKDGTGPISSAFAQPTTTLKQNVSSGQSQIAVASTAGFSPGDFVLLIDVQGSTASTGTYEISHLAAVSSSTMTVTHGTKNGYVASDKVIVQRVPQFTTLTVPTGMTVSPNAWDGQAAGIIALMARDALTVNGTVDASGRGYRGGARAVCPTSTCYSQAGEGIVGPPANQGNTAENYGGGGAAQFINCANSPETNYCGGNPTGLGFGAGGGGGHLTSGKKGSWDASGAFGTGYAKQGKLFFGAGGGGGTNPASGSNWDGGPGGGIIILASPSISFGSGGSIAARGASGHHASAYDAGGGSGAGGTIRVITLGGINSALLNVDGGADDPTGGTPAGSPGVIVM